MTQQVAPAELGTGPQCVQAHYFCFSCEGIVCGLDASHQHESLGHELSRSFAPRSARARRRICGLEVADHDEHPAQSPAASWR